MNPVVLELRHVECEGPAAYLPVLEQYAQVRTVRLGRDPVPPALDYAAVVVMGGPMGVADAATLPWLGEEIAYLRSAVAAGIPVWGVCLGAQLLAAALGADVYTGPVPEVGVGEVELAHASAADPVWGELPSTFPVLQWHADTFDLPPGATLLASSRAYPNQVFRHGSSYGVQFHLEADADQLGGWLAIDEYRASLEAALGPGSADAVAAELRSVQPETVAHAAAVMKRWLETYVV
ncbi:type 1 glutamine amidotransferase [Rhodococcus aetherivorans]